MMIQSCKVYYLVVTHIIPAWIPYIYIYIYVYIFIHTHIYVLGTGTRRAPEQRRLRATTRAPAGIRARAPEGTRRASEQRMLRAATRAPMGTKAQAAADQGSCLGATEALGDNSKTISQNKLGKNPYLQGSYLGNLYITYKYTYICMYI